LTHQSPVNRKSNHIRALTSIIPGALIKRRDSTPIDFAEKSFVLFSADVFVSHCLISLRKFVFQLHFPQSHHKEVKLYRCTKCPPSSGDDITSSFTLALGHFDQMNLKKPLFYRGNLCFSSTLPSLITKRLNCTGVPNVLHLHRVEMTPPVFHPTRSLRLMCAARIHSNRPIFVRAFCLR
jgi:hypothetical protein